MSNLKTSLMKINTQYDNFTKKSSSENCFRLSTAMKDLEEMMREYIQDITKGELEQIISKLKSNKQLDKHEIDYIKLWIVGDAQHYAQLENNYKDWLNEVERLMKEINKINADNPDFVASSRLRATLMDGVRTLNSVMYFLTQEERLKNFLESTQEIDPEERDLLIRLLEGKISSPDA